jgi:glycogen synthase kinase 3 beta
MKTPPEAIDLMSKILVYEPSRRLKPLEALLHPFFDELREQEVNLPTGDLLTLDLFDFTREEVESTAPEIIEQLIPKWYGGGGK